MFLKCNYCRKLKGWEGTQESGRVYISYRPSTQLTLIPISTGEVLMPVFLI